MKYPITRLPQSSDIRYARSQVAAASAYALDTPGVTMAGTNALRAFTIACEIACPLISDPEAHSGTFDAAITKRHAELIKTQAWGVAHALACWAGYYVREPDEMPVTRSEAIEAAARAQGIPVVELNRTIGGSQLPPGTRVVAALPPAEYPADRYGETPRTSSPTAWAEFVSDDGADPDAPIPYAPVAEVNQGAKYTAGMEMADRVRAVLQDGYETMDGPAADVTELLRGIRHFCFAWGVRFEDALDKSCELFLKDRE